jgi:hypothetical protein
MPVITKSQESGRHATGSVAHLPELMSRAYSSEKQYGREQHPYPMGTAPWSAVRASVDCRVNRSTATAAAGLGTILFGIINSF